jgi:hypothetical protein
MAYNSSKKLSGNIAALRLAFSEQENFSEEEIAVLKSYAGFGGLKAVLFGAGDRESWVQQNASANDLRLHPLMMELHELLQEKLPEKDYKSAVDALKTSITTAYYTPELVPAALYAAMNQQQLTPLRLYEPSSGAGIFITEALKAFPDLQEINAVEKDVLTGKVLMALALTLPVSFRFADWRKRHQTKKVNTILLPVIFPSVISRFMTRLTRAVGLQRRFMIIFLPKGSTN